MNTPSWLKNLKQRIIVASEVGSMKKTVDDFKQMRNAMKRQQGIGHFVQGFEKVRVK